jgi:hypothetical protein
MNPSEFLSREIIRPLITLAIPGGVVIAPYVYLLHTNATVVNLWENHETALIFFLLVISLAVGLLLEDIGARIEKEFFDCVEKNDPTWNEYLKKPSYSELKDLDHSPKGTHITETSKDYISSIVLRLKFELGMLVAIVFAIPGLVLIMRFNCQELLDNYNWIIGVILLLMPIYLLIESCNSVYLLHERRKNIVKDAQENGQIENAQENGQIEEAKKNGQIEEAKKNGQIEEAKESKKVLVLIVIFAVIGCILAIFIPYIPSFIFYLIIAILILMKLLKSTINILSFIFVVGFSLLPLLALLLSIFLVPVTTLCIAHPALNTKFLMSSSVPFEGEAYGDIEKVRLLDIFKNYNPVTACF